MSHVFICHSSKDQTTAHGVVEFLEAEGLKCWISSRDIPPGHNYQESIVHALETARGIVFLFSDASGGSGEIRKELSLAGSYNTPVFPLRLSPITPSGALRYELATRQWIDIFPDREKALARLAETIRAGLDASPAAASVTERAAAPAPTAAASMLVPGSEEFEAIRALLARYIGPIAKVLLQKAASEARTPEDLCARLAAHVSASSDRAAFLQAARARLAVKS